MLNFNDYLDNQEAINEGVYDKNIFKAFFLAGGPGSGKSWVSARTLMGQGMKVINSDDGFERYAKNAGLNLKKMGSFTAAQTKKKDALRSRAKVGTAYMHQHAIDGLCDEILVQVAYAIGVAKPMGLYVDTYGTSKTGLTDGEIARKLEAIFDMRPYAIEKRFSLRTPIYSETAAYGHMGRTCETINKEFKDAAGQTKNITVKLFPWEDTDYVSKVKEAFGL